MIMETYIFFREDVFYPIVLQNDMDAIENAKCNVGTIRVENEFGKVIWVLDKSKSN